MSKGMQMYTKETISKIKLKVENLTLLIEQEELLLKFN